MTKRKPPQILTAAEALEKLNKNYFVGQTELMDIVSAFPEGTEVAVYVHAFKSTGKEPHLRQAVVVGWRKSKLLSVVLKIGDTEEEELSLNPKAWRLAFRQTGAELQFDRASRRFAVVFFFEGGGQCERYSVQAI